MAQIKVPAASFGLLCEFKCSTTEIWQNVGGTRQVISVEHGIYETPAPQSKTVAFAVDLPEGAVIKSAKVFATLNSPLYGAEICRINGVAVDVLKTVSVDVEIADGATVVEVPFRFLCGTPTHTHATNSSFADIIWREDDGSWGYDKWLYRHESRLDYESVYLLIEYEGGAGYVHRAEGGKLVPYRLCRAEGGKLVPYRLHRAEAGKLVPY